MCFSQMPEMKHDIPVGITYQEFPQTKQALESPKKLMEMELNFFFFKQLFLSYRMSYIIWQLLAMKLLKYRNCSRKSLGKRKWRKWKSHKDRNQLVCRIGWVAMCDFAKANDADLRKYGGSGGEPGIHQVKEPH